MPCPSKSNALISHIDENFTQEELSLRFDIPLANMKNCFKSVYGQTIGDCLTEYRSRME